MAVGTDEEIFQNGKKKEETIRKAGRPSVDRDLALRLFQAKYDNTTVAGHLGVKPRTAQRIRRELVRDGLLDRVETERELVSTDFDEECKRATGYSFRDWLMGKRKRDNAQYTFNYCEKVWREIWDRPSLFLASERGEKLGDQLAQSFLKTFGEDRDRIRGRKKLIRQLFLFLGRKDVCDRHLTMPTSSNPRSVRRIPEISMEEFPIHLDAALNEFQERYGLKAVVWLWMKICTGIRTGDKGEQRGLLGMRADSQSKTFIIFRGNTWKAQAFEKRGETWPITWIPPKVLDGIRELVKEAEAREDKTVFNWSSKVKTDLSKAWKAISKKHTGAELEFHDLRKVSITWLYAMDIPLEIATSINVGWKDLTTARDHYLELRAFLKKSARLAYRNNIPDWYKPGLEEYAREAE